MVYKHLPANIPEVLRGVGLTVVEIPGWHGRGRPASTGGFAPVGVLCHHTGSYDGIADAKNDRDYAQWLATEGRPDLSAPLAHFALSAEGVVYVLASGRANHAGRAKASGSVAAGDGNALYIGIEAMNDGSQGWGTRQYDAYVLLAAALCVKVTGNSYATVRGHKETSTTGKWDPGKLDMGRFRSDVKLEITRLEGGNMVDGIDKRLIESATRQEEMQKAILRALGKNPQEALDIADKINDNRKW